MLIPVGKMLLALYRYMHRLGVGWFCSFHIVGRNSLRFQPEELLLPGNCVKLIFGGEKGMISYKDKN